MVQSQPDGEAGVFKLLDLGDETSDRVTKANVIKVAGNEFRLHLLQRTVERQTKQQWPQGVSLLNPLSG
jgi:hypothetical protein